MYGRWAYRGALFGLLLAIAYDTSSNTAALEGGHAHLSYGGTILWTFWGLLAGLVLAFVRTKIEVRVRRRGAGD